MRQGHRPHAPPQRIVLHHRQRINPLPPHRPTPVFRKTPPHPRLPYTLRRASATHTLTPENQPRHTAARAMAGAQRVPAARRPPPGGRRARYSAALLKRSRARTHRVYTKARYTSDTVGCVSLSTLVETLVLYGFVRERQCERGVMVLGWGSIRSIRQGTREYRYVTSPNHDLNSHVERVWCDNPNGDESIAHWAMLSSFTRVCK